MPGSMRVVIVSSSGYREILPYLRMSMSWFGVAYTCQRSTFAYSFAYLSLSSEAREANEVLLERPGVVVKLSCYKVEDLV